MKGIQYLRKADSKLFDFTGCILSQALRCEPTGPREARPDDRLREPRRTTGMTWAVAPTAVMPGTRVRLRRPEHMPCAGHPPLGRQERRGWPGHRRAERRRPSDGYARP